MHPTDSKLAILKTEITLTRRKLNQAWAVNQKTDAAVLAIGVELDKLCNEYERVVKAAKSEICQK